MNTLLLIAAVFPIAVGGLLRRVPTRVACRITMAALLPLVFLALGIWLHPSRQLLVPHWRLLSMLVAFFSAGFAYHSLKRSPFWPFVQASLILLVGFLVLLLLSPIDPVAMVALANLPALLLQFLQPVVGAYAHEPTIGAIHRKPISTVMPAAPATLLAAVGVSAAFFVPSTSPGELSIGSGGAMGIVVAALIWQLLIHLFAGQPNAQMSRTEPPTALATSVWPLQRQVRAASVAAILLVLFQLRPLINQSPFTLSVLIILAASMFIIVGSLLLMERRIIALLSLMEYVWIGGFLVGLCAPRWLQVGMERNDLVWIFGFMAFDCWLASRLVNAGEERLNLDTIIGWRFSRAWDAVWLSILILGMQFLPVMPACHFLLRLLAGLAVGHPIIAVLLVAANGTMLVVAFRVLGAMYLVPSQPRDLK